MTQELSTPDALTARLMRLTSLSRREPGTIYHHFNWVDSLDHSRWWTSPALLTLAGTSLYDAASEATRRELGKWECINLFSINVHGIRDLLVEVMRRMHTAELHEADEYLHHFVEEENQHMWFFAEFCRRYGGRVYANKKAKLNPETDPFLETFLVFARIYIFEEVGDFYNAAMMNDAQLHPLVREIHAAHHEDEARHISFGRAIFESLAHRLVGMHPPEVVADVGTKLMQFSQIMLQSLYNPEVYRNAGFASGMAVRTELLASPVRRAHHRKVMGRANKLFVKTGLVSEDVIHATPCFAG